MAPLPFLTRLWFAWACFFRVLFDGLYAARLYASQDAAALPPAPAKGDDDEAKPAKADKAEPKVIEKVVERVVEKVVEVEKAPSTDAALQLLALLQREGRFVDFLEEDVASFADADIGAAARVVHAGCRKALREHVKLEPVREEEEGAKLTLEEGFKSEEVKLTGNVSGKGPYSGTLRHKGWRAKEVTMPTAVEGHDARIIAQAEVEL